MHKAPPPGHQWITTEDGSLTLFSEAFQEGCHSTSGAESETLLHYVQGCEVEARASRKAGFTILEVGFGLGVGLLTTLKALRGLSHSFKFISLEIDRNLVNWFIEQFGVQGQWQETTFHGQLENCELIVIVGDARKALPDFIQTHSVQWNAIYQDAFSPKRNPSLWTREWFSLLKTRAAADVVMSTYSASTSIRKAMLEAGWLVSKGEKFGPKRSSTRAKLTGENDPEILLQLERSPSPALTDENIELFLKGWKA